MIKLRASKLQLREVSLQEEKQFLNENHYQGFVPSLWCKGLYDDDKLVILMSFGTPRYNKRFDWELLRLATKKDYQVYGGASKLFNDFKDNNVGSIISYCNESLFSGKVYDILGFSKHTVINSYHYEKDGKSYHRTRFMKCRLIKQYPEYADKTEKEIMQILGYDRINEKQATYVYGTKWYIYEITNNINGKTYIGQHLDRGDNYWGSGTNIRRAIEKYGVENFSKRIILDNIHTQKDADKYELCAIRIQKLVGKAEYNIIDDKYTPKHIFPNGCLPMLGKHHTEETKRKIGEHQPKNKNNGKALSETRKNQYWASKGMLGKHLSQSSKEQLSKSLLEYHKNKDGTIPKRAPQIRGDRETKISLSLRSKKSVWIRMNDNTQWGYMLTTRQIAELNGSNCSGRVKQYIVKYGYVNIRHNRYYCRLATEAEINEFLASFYTPCNA